MDPINKKERTLSFLQFLVIFLLTIIFVITGVFFDAEFFRKDYEVLKKRAGQLNTIEALNGSIIRLNQEFNDLESKVRTEYDWDKNRGKLEDEIEKVFTLGTDSSEFQKLGLSLQETYKNALYDKKKFIDSKDCSSKIKEKEDIIKQMEKDYKELEKERDKLEIALQKMTPLN